MDRKEIAWRSYLDDRLAEIGERIAEAERRVTDLQAERRVLQQMKSDPPSFFSEDDDVSPNSAPGETARLEGPTPTEAVDELVASEPGLTRKEIINRLEQRVASDAEDIRATISSAVGRRLKKGVFMQDGRERIWPRNHEKAQEIIHQERLYPG